MMRTSSIYLVRDTEALRSMPAPILKAHTPKFTRRSRAMKTACGSCSASSPHRAECPAIAGRTSQIPCTKAESLGDLFSIACCGRGDCRKNKYPSGPAGDFTWYRRDTPIGGYYHLPGSYPRSVDRRSDFHVNPCADDRTIGRHCSWSCTAKALRRPPRFAQYSSRLADGRKGRFQRIRDELVPGGGNYVRPACFYTSNQRRQISMAIEIQLAVVSVLRSHGKGIP